MRRELLPDLSQCSAEAIAEYMRTQLRAQVRPVHEVLRVPIDEEGREIEVP
jgi:hypothetical protein